MIIIESDIEDETHTLLELNGIVREDGFVNATQMCKACGKGFFNWYRLDATKELKIQKLRSEFRKNCG